MFLDPDFLLGFFLPSTSFRLSLIQPDIEKKGDIAGAEWAARKQCITQGCSHCCYRYRSPASTCAAGGLLQAWRATVLALIYSKLNISQGCPQELPFPSANPGGCCLRDGMESLLGLSQSCSQITPSSLFLGDSKAGLCSSALDKQRHNLNAKDNHHIILLALPISVQSLVRPLFAADGALQLERRETSNTKAQVTW